MLFRTWHRRGRMPDVRWERIWTVLATCAQQNRSAFDFIYRSIIAHFNEYSFPSLLPLPP